MNPIPNASCLGYFAIYTAWLASFAMAGPLQDGDVLLHFLVPHILGFLVLTHPLIFHFTQPALLLGVVISALGTALYPFSGAAAPAIMLLLGLASVPLSVRTLIALNSLERPLVAAVIALTLAHLLMLILTNLLPQSTQLGPLFLAMLLLALIKVPPVQSIHTKGSIRGIGQILLVIFVFQIVSGLMYAGLFPAHMEYGFLAETHVVMLMYPVGAVLLLPLYRLGLNIPLLAGIFIALLGFSLWRLIPPPLGANIGMPLTLSATGLIDIVFIAHILSFTNLRKSVGYGLAVLCSGILLGRVLGLWVADDRNLIGLLGLLILNLSVMLLYLLDAHHSTRRLLRNGEREIFPDTPLLASLSEQERLVLDQIARKATYRDIAQSLGISESSVKTYVQRIYRKAGVYNRQQLFTLLGLTK